MDTIVVSDVHIGSQYFHSDRFLEFLDAIPADCSLVLNGDTIHDPKGKLTDDDRAVLDRLATLSERATVVWLCGNHDPDFQPPVTGKIVFKESHAVGKRLYISHGDYFDTVMTHHQWFIRTFRFLHNVRITLGAHPVHVAVIAKKWRALFNYVRQATRMNAVEYARENGFQAVTCGHIHYAEDTYVDGIRYINTGSWTETPTYCVIVNHERISLMKTEEWIP